MHKIFVPIYNFFKGHKMLMYLIMGISTVVFIVYGLKLHFEEDITRLLPSSSVESQLAFSSIQLKDKIYIQVTSADEPLSTDILAERADEFIELLYEKDSSNHFISNVLYKLEPEVAINALDFVLEHIPSFIDTSAYHDFEKALEPEAIEKQMWVNYEQMMEDETGDITQAIMYDPDEGDRTSVCFWEMIHSLGLENMSDAHFNQDYVDDIIFRFMNREYLPNGQGGLFTIDNCDEDLRTVEIWYQLCWYLNTYY